MSTTFAEITISLDGFVAGPDATLELPLGVGGRALHEWAMATRTFRRQHGTEGGETGTDDEIASGSVEGVGAEIMGRRKFSGGSGSWENDPNARGWWGDNPPFHHPVFVLTHHAREPLEMEGGTTFHFVTEGIERAMELAREAAGDQKVIVGGGGETIRQFLAAGLLDEMRIHIAPVLLGAGAPLFDDALADPPKLEAVRLETSPAGVLHGIYRVIR